MTRIPSSSCRLLLVGCGLMMGLVAHAGAQPFAATAPGPHRSAAEPDPGEEVREEPELTIYFENDGTFIKPNNSRDRHYTNGAGLSLTHHPDWARQLSEWVPLSPAKRVRTGGGLLLGHRIYTPENFRAQRLLPDDRPYAGHLFGGVYWQRASATGYGEDAVMDHVQVNLGVVGPAALGRPVQDLVHKLVNVKDFDGWDNQLDNEPTFQAYLRRKWRMNTGGFDVGTQRLTTQVIPELGTAVGTVRLNAMAGATFRVGANLPDDFGPPRLADPADAVGRTREGWGGYAFGRAAARAVGHNLFLAGGTFNDGPGVDAEPLVGEVEVGARVYYQAAPWRYELGYSQTFLTPQFKQQDSGDAHAALTISVRGLF